MKQDHIFWYNKRWFEYTGTNIEKMTGWGWRKVHHPEYVDAVEKKFRRMIEKGQGLGRYFSTERRQMEIFVGFCQELYLSKMKKGK